MPRCSRRAMNTAAATAVKPMPWISAIRGSNENISPPSRRYSPSAKASAAITTSWARVSAARSESGRNDTRARHKGAENRFVIAGFAPGRHALPADMLYNAAMTRRRLYLLLQPRTPTVAARVFRIVHHAMVAAGIAIMLAVTVAAIREGHAATLTAAFLSVALFFVAEFLMRLYVAPEAPGEHRGAARARLAWLFSLAGLFDFLGALPGVVDLVGSHDARLFSFIWIFKYVRYSEGLGGLGRVIVQSRHALLSVLLGFVVVLLAAASLAYLFERQANPTGFGSIPSALWWAIVTMTTTGYGDVVPMTLAGRMLSGVVMMCGI